MKLQEKDIDEKLVRKCSGCGIKLYYRNVHTKNVADNRDSVCKLCVKNKISNSVKKSHSKLNVISKISIASKRMWNNTSFRKRMSAARKLWYKTHKHPMLGKKHTEEHKQKISKSLKGRVTWNKGIPQTFKVKQKISLAVRGKNNPFYGKKHTLETRLKMSRNHADVSGKKNPMYGTKGWANLWSDDIKRKKYRKQREDRLSKVTPNFNPHACKIIDEYGKKHEYNFQHALNGGERRFIGYSVDGYDEKKNVIIEYYEPWHNRPNQKLKDEKRKQELINHLGCKFLEIREKDII
jgi:hypothetical protein